MEERVKDLIGQGDFLFTKKRPLLTLWQEIADNYYPERADFTVSRSLSEEFADNLMTSYPVIMRRDLGNSISAMLRPAGKEWFHIGLGREEGETLQVKRYLEYFTSVQRRAMYDRQTRFTEATKLGDHDFASFGQCVIGVKLNPRVNKLLYQCWHLRDVVWCDNVEGETDTVHRKWKPTARMLNDLFGSEGNEYRNGISDKVKRCLEKEPYREIECRHICIPTDSYGSTEKYNTPYVSIYVDVENNHIMEETGVWDNEYVIPRWARYGSQYAYSPASIASLPDARLLQAQTLTLLEAGEKAVNPPLVAKTNIFREEFNYMAGGLSFADLKDNEKINDVLSTLTNDKSGLPFGMDMREDVKLDLLSAWYLNKLNLPQQNGDMTAYEVSERIKEFIRSTLPLFEPMEHEYNGALCEKTFNVLMRNNAFGPMDDLPIEMQGQDIQFKFESPLHDAIEREKAQVFNESRAIVMAAAEIDPTAVHNWNAVKASRAAMEGIRTPSEWLRDEKEVEELVQAQREMITADKQNQQAQEEARVVQEEAAATQMVEANA